MSDGQIEISILADLNQFESAIKKVGSIASTNLGGLGNTLSTIGGKMQSIGGALTAGFTVPLTAAAGVAGKFALDTIAAAEQSSIAFETMLGPEKAKAMLEDLADFAANTPFELQGLQESTQKLIAMGFEADECIPLLTAIGDAASGLGAGQEGIDSITRALGQMNAKGKASAEEMMQLTETGIPAWQYLADTISGGDIPAAMDMVSKGAVDADTAIQALQDGMNRDFGGMMSKQAQTLTGVLSNMSDAIQKPLMSLKDTKGYEALTSALSRLSQQLGPFVESLMPHLENVLYAASDGVDFICDRLNDFTNMSMSGQAGVLKMIASVAASGPALTIMGKGLQGVGSVIGVLNKQVVTADGTTTTYAGKIKSMAGNMGIAKIAAGGLAGILATMFIGAAITSISDMIERTNQLNEATTGLTHAQEDAQEAVQTTSTAMSSSSFENYKTGVQDAIDATARLAGEFQKSWEEYYTNETLLNQYVGTIERLAGKSDLTATEQTELANAVEGYNKITGDTVEVIDATNGKLSESTDEIKKNTEEWLKNAKAQAYQEKIMDLQKQQIDNEKSLNEARENYEKKKKDFDELSKAGVDTSGMAGDVLKAKKDLEDIQKTYNSTSGAIQDYTEKMAGADQSLTSWLGSNEAAMNAMAELCMPIEDATAAFTALGTTQGELSEMSQEQIQSLLSNYQQLTESGMSIDTLKSTMEGLGISQQQLADMTPDQITNLVSAYSQLQSAGYSADTIKQAMSDLGISQTQLAEMTPDQISNLMAAYSQFSGAGINMQEMKSKMDEVGLTQENLANLTPSQIATITSAYSSGKADIGQICDAIKNNTIDKLGTAGSEGGQAYADGMRSKTGETKGGGRDIAQSGKDGADEVDTSSTGQNFVDGFLNPIVNNIGKAFSDAFAFVSNAVAGAQQAQDSHSPSKKTQQLARWFIQGYVDPIKSSRESYYAGQAMANRALDGLEAGANSVINTASNLASQIADAMATDKAVIPIDAEVTRLIVPPNATAELSQVSAMGILGMDQERSYAYLLRIANGIDTTNSKLDEMSNRLGRMERKIESSLASPTQIKVNNQVFGRLVREVV